MPLRSNLPHSYMGVANVIPGVSGGTMTFILVVFEELVNSISKITSMKKLKLVLGFNFKELFNTINWKFRLALGIGII